MPFIFQWEDATDSHGNVITENVPGDDGGTTKYGIDKASHPDIDIPNLTKETALAIYWSEWNKAQAELLPYPYGEAYFNCCVNAGRGRALKLESAVDLQRNKEQWAAKDVDQMEASVFLDEQEAFYRRLAQDAPHDAKFLKGWLNRLIALREWLKLPPRAEEQ